MHGEVERIEDPVYESRGHHETRVHLEERGRERGGERGRERGNVRKFTCGIVYVCLRGFLSTEAKHLW